VGVDMPRLGLMLVNGQPKSMAEYIQATSRVGRNEIPGLIVSMYNDGKPRDRAHYEAHLSWLLAPYREVEANSVTPWASRTRDKAIRAAVVAIARHRCGLLDKPHLDDNSERILRGFVREMLSRIERIDPSEVNRTRLEIQDFITEWRNRYMAVGNNFVYWNERRVGYSLLISWEMQARENVLGNTDMSAQAAPNSMRNVEPGMTCRARYTGLRQEPREGEDGET